MTSLGKPDPSTYSPLKTNVTQQQHIVVGPTSQTPEKPISGIAQNTGILPGGDASTSAKMPVGDTHKTTNITRAAAAEDVPREVRVENKVVKIDVEAQRKYRNPDHLGENYQQELTANRYKGAESTPVKTTIKPFAKPNCSVMEVSPALAKDGIDEATAVAFVDHVMGLIVDPVRLLGHLKLVDDEVSKKLQADGITFDPHTDKPEFLIAGQGYFIPGPPPPGHKAKTSEDFLSDILLSKEQPHGINQGGAPVFVGGIDSDIANAFVMEGHIFKEDTEISSLLLHGEESHRLLFQALCESVKGTSLEHLKPIQILRMLIGIQVTERSQKNNLWVQLMDTLTDTSVPLRIPEQQRRISQYEDGRLLDPSNYGFSSRSPFTFNSLIACFGEELGLKNLQYCVLDNHWKTANLMVDRMVESRQSFQQGAPTGDDVEDRAGLYVLAMEGIGCLPIDDIGQGAPYNLDVGKAKFKPQYRNYEERDRSAGAIKYKLKTGETISANEMKRDRLAMMDDDNTLRELATNPEMHSLILEKMLAKDTPPAQVRSMLFICIMESLRADDRGKQAICSLLEQMVAQENKIRELSQEDKNEVRSYFWRLTIPEFTQDEAMRSRYGAVVQKMENYGAK